MTAPERDPALPVTAHAPKPQATDDVVLFEDRLYPVAKTERDDPHQWLCQLHQPDIHHLLNGTRDLPRFNVASLSLLERHLRLATVDDIRHALKTNVRIFVAKRRTLPTTRLGPWDLNTDSAYREALEAQAYLNGHPHPSP